MQKKQVAVIDVGSSKITAIIGERGVNKTFVIKTRMEYAYDGYADREFFDEKVFTAHLNEISRKIVSLTHGKIETVFVGVPGEFSNVTVKESQISFPSKRKIKEVDVDALFDGGFAIHSQKSTLINRSAVVYELDDCRRLADPVGSQSGILKGKLSFITCDNYFIDLVNDSILSTGIKRVEFVSSSLAQALYLIEPEVRDRISVICDIGYISSTLTIIQGDGILYQTSFGFGGGYITAEIANKFDLDFSSAEKLKSKVNLSALSGNGCYSLIESDGEYYQTEHIKSSVIFSLDSLCEQITTSLDQSGYSLPEYVPLSITGGGISFIRGAREHLSNRLSMSVEILSPKVPLMDKPTESDVLSLLNLALEQ